MDDGDGAYTMEMQAKSIAQNITMYNGSAPCPACGGVMNPVEFITNRGLCQPCLTKRNVSRVKDGMV